MLKLGFFFQVSCKVILYVIFYYSGNSSSNVWFTLCIWSCLSKLVCKCALQSIVPPQIMSHLMHCFKTWILELLISHWFPMWDFVCSFNLHVKTCYHWQYYFMSKILLQKSVFCLGELGSYFFPDIWLWRIFLVSLMKHSHLNCCQNAIDMRKLFPSCKRCNLSFSIKSTTTTVIQQLQWNCTMLVELFCLWDCVW